MKLRLPISLLSALLAVFVLAKPVAGAVEVPTGYGTPIYLDDADQLSSYSTSTSKTAFLLDASVTFSSSTATWWTYSKPLKSSGSILFTIEEDGDPYSLTFKDAARQAFDLTSLRVEDIGSLKFSNIKHSYDEYGGAIYATEVLLRGNQVVTFEQNRVDDPSDESSYGGAIYATSRVAVDENKGAVSFTGNYAYSYDSSYSSSAYGGAIYGTGSTSISICGNSGGVTLSENYARSSSSSRSSYSYGGAIYGGDSSSISLSGNTGGVTITGNYASSSTSAYGGAIYGGSSSSISLSGNTGGVTITGNYASSSYYSYGGAIYTEGSIAIQNNDTVLFSGNYEKLSSSSSYRLRSIYMDSRSSTGGSFQLSAAAGSTITFEDSIYVATSTSGQTVNVVFNGSYTDAAGATVAQAGDIIFDAASVETTLADIKGSSATANEIADSRTSYIGGQIELQAGRLIVRNGAQLNGLGLATTRLSGAAVVLENAGMNHAGTVSLRKGTSLELSGQNTVVADRLSFSSGSTLKLALTGDHRESAVLGLDANLEHFSFGIALDGQEMLASGRYKLVELADASQYEDVAGYWKADSITVSATGDAAGLGFENLVWEDGVLYVEQGKSIWTNAGGDGTWNTTSTNWSRNGQDITYRDGMDVLFDGTAAGTVQLEGEVAPLSVTVENAAGQDYTFSGSGKLTGSTGIVKNGEGELSLATANEHTGGTQLNGGSLRVQHSSALGATTATLSTAAGSRLSIENGAQVVLAAAEGNDLAGSVSIAAGASLEMQGSGYRAESTQLAGELLFNTTGVSQQAGSLSGSGHLKVQGAGTAVQFASAASYAGSVSLANGATLTTDMLKVGANATLAALAAGTSVSLGDVVGTGAAQVEMQTTKFESYTGTFNADVAANAYTAGTLSTEGGLVLQGGATYQANGSSIDLGGSTLTMAGSAENPFISLMLELDKGYTPVDTQIVLFSGVSAFNVGGVEFSSTETAYVFSASDYLKGEYVFETTALVYDGNVGVVYLVEAVPEPATTTLSLLALAGLCARRRRKE